MHSVFRRRALIRSLPALALAAPASLPSTAYAQAVPARLTEQDRADLARVEQYLNGVRALKSRFLQVAPDGRTSGGQAWLQRPGRMRFQYDPPAPFLLVAGNGLVVFHDSRLNQTSNIPIGSTPLGILLRDRSSLSGDVTVTGVQRQPGQLHVSLVRTATPADGTLTLVFTDPPLQLRQWTVLDAQRQETRVTLYDVQLGGTYDSKLFQFVDPNFFVPQQGSGG